MGEVNKRILGIEVLPITVWEAPYERKTLPLSIQLLLNAPIPVLRVPITIHLKQTSDAKHLWLRPLFDDLDALLQDWEIIVPLEGRVWRILQHVALPVTGERAALMTVVGVDLSGSYNLVSMHKRTEAFFQRQLRDDNAILREG